MNSKVPHFVFTIQQFLPNGEDNFVQYLQKKIGECNELYTSFENYIFPIEMNILGDDMNRESGTKQHS